MKYIQISESYKLPVSFVIRLADEIRNAGGNPVFLADMSDKEWALLFTLYTNSIKLPTIAECQTEETK